MIYQPTTASKKVFSLTKRIRGVSGGTAASKTVSILQWLIDRAWNARQREIISVVSESMPHLRRGAMRDFLDILQDNGMYNDYSWERTNSIYTFPTGTIVEFFGVDDWNKVKGPRRDIVFINEANHISYESYTHLEVRTKKFVWMDWNPESEFYWYTDIVGKVDCDFLVLTYKDNEMLDSRIIESIESRQSNLNWWRVYGLGELGEVEARVYTGWQIIDDVPKDAQLKRYGLDFGFTNDPATLVGIYRWNKSIILDEVFYQTGMINHDIALAIKQQPQALVIADSAEPKSIEEIHREEIQIIGSLKGADSVLHGIQYVQGLNILITKRSVNGLKEYRSYLWMTDKNGRNINTPQEGNDHFLSAARYGLERGFVNTIGAGPIKIDSPKRTVPQWVVNPQGQIQGQDFWKAFKEDQQRRHSTAGAEFKRRV